MATRKHFIATWPELNTSVECAPFDDESNIWIYDWYMDYLARKPIKFIQIHAMVTGTVMYTWANLDCDLPAQGDHILTKHSIIKAPPGTGLLAYNVPCGLAGGRTSHITFHYGSEKYEDMTSYYCFHVIDEDLPKLKAVGEEVANRIYRSKKPVTCVLTLKED